MPCGGEVVWRWFVDLAAARRQSGMGTSPLVWADVGAYFRLWRTVPRPWELQALRALDGVYLRVAGEIAEQRRRAGKRAGEQA
jgi:hypothetical protein